MNIREIERKKFKLEEQIYAFETDRQGSILSHTTGAISIAVAILLGLSTVESGILVRTYNSLGIMACFICLHFHIRKQKKVIEETKHIHYKNKIQISCIQTILDKNKRKQK